MNTVQTFQLVRKPSNDRTVASKRTSTNILTVHIFINWKIKIKFLA